MAMTLANVAEDQGLTLKGTRSFLRGAGIPTTRIRRDITRRVEGAPKEYDWIEVVANPEDFYRWRAHQWFEADQRGEPRKGGKVWSDSPIHVSSIELGLSPVELTRIPVQERLERNYPDAVSSYMRLALEGAQDGTQSQ